MTTAPFLRNIIAIMGSIDRHEIEAEAGPITEKAWSYFWNNPYRGFLSFGDHHQSAIARIVSARMGPAGGEGVVGSASPQAPEGAETTTTPEASDFKTCERCQGNGEIVTDWDRYRHPHEGDKGDEAVAECPDCGGEGWIDPSYDDFEGGFDTATLTPADTALSPATDTEGYR